MPPRPSLPSSRLDAAMSLWLRFSLASLAAAALVVLLASYGASQSLWLGRSLTWWQELSAACHASLLFLSAAHVLGQGAHLRIDLLYRRWAPAQRGRADRLFAWIAGLPLMVLLLATALPWAWRAWSRLEASANPSGLASLYLVKSLLVLAGLHGLAMVLRAGLGRERAAP